MRLKSLTVDGFKNLNKFEINFERREGITVLIGNNGSGKSNILEAISAIFAGLYNNTLDDLPFKFDLIYSIESNNKKEDIRISKKIKTRYRFKKSSVVTWKTIKLTDLYSYGDSTFLPEFPFDAGESYDYRPSQLIALYSGEELRLWNDYYSNFYLKYNTEVIANKTKIETTQKMLYVNKYYWDIALLTMLASDIDLTKIIGDIKITAISFKFNKEALKAYSKNSPNAVTAFVSQLSQEENVAGQMDLEMFQDKSNFVTHRELFKLLCVAKLPKESNHKLILDLKLTFDNGLTTQDFSEGQKKQILFKLALDILADENALILFDEPDSHIHIAKKQHLADMIKESEKEVVLTTHSPTLMNTFDEKHLFYLENGKKADIEKVDILKQLSGDTMSLVQQQILLHSNDDILIVEGKTDEKYITTALEKLGKITDTYKNLKFNFLWLGGSDSETLNSLIDKFQPKNEQTIITFFDRDDAGFKCIKTTLNYSGEKENFNGEVKKNIHIYFYPKKEGFSKSNFEVEDYFDIEKCRDFTFKEITSFENLKSRFKKDSFAEECKNFEPEDFNGFKVLFDLIINIKSNNLDELAD